MNRGTAHMKTVVYGSGHDNAWAGWPPRRPPHPAASEDLPSAWAVVAENAKPTRYSWTGYY
jgi:hypothetical protein